MVGKVFAVNVICGINFTSIFPPEGGDLKLIAPFINGKSKGEEEKKLSEREKAIREETACEGEETKALSEGAAEHDIYISFFANL